MTALELQRLEADKDPFVRKQLAYEVGDWPHPESALALRQAEWGRKFIEFLFQVTLSVPHVAVAFAGVEAVLDGGDLGVLACVVDLVDGDAALPGFRMSLRELLRLPSDR